MDHEGNGIDKAALPQMQDHSPPGQSARDL
jgi:hypothetical protein